MKNGKAKFLSIDIGGTKIAICKFDEKYKSVFYLELATDNFPIGSMKFINSIKKFLLENFEVSIEKIGISFNCSVKNGRIVYSSILGGKLNYSLEKNFSKIFSVPVKLRNDVSSMAIAEYKFSKGRRVDNFVLMNLGTGLRIAYVAGGKIIDGYSGNAGEISQKKVFVPVISEREVLLEDVVCGKGLSKVYFKLTGRKNSAKEIFSFCKKGDMDAKKAVGIFVENLAYLLQDLSYFYNPEKIVISGSLKKSADIFLPQAIRLYKNITSPIFYFRKIEISKLKYGACLGVIVE